MKATDRFDVLVQDHHTFEGPHLKRLYTLAKQLNAYGKNDPKFNPDIWWYACFKPTLLNLVGFHCDNPELQGTEPYDLCYRVLYGALSGEAQ